MTRDFSLPIITTYQPLTPSTTFIGRKQELLILLDILMNKRHRLLTLVGSGGIGKTRLALEMAHQVVDDYLYGAVFVSLTPLTSVETIVPTIATALNFRFQRDTLDYTAQLLNFLSEKHLLMILDNFEHLLEGADLVPAILEAAPNVQIVVTSREPLNVAEERVYEVKGMDYTPNASADAVALFLERAQQVQSGFDIEREFADVVKICHLVQGLPLALEIAASWVKTLSGAAIAQQIQHGLDFLTYSKRNISERHRSIRAVFDHSWSLLNIIERTAFQRLSIFRGSFSLEAALQITKTSLSTLAALIDKSLVQKSADERYELHELVRQYTYERLNMSSQIYYMCDLHCTYYAHMIRQFTKDLKSHQQSKALDAMSVDFENIKIAWQWAVAQSKIDALRDMIEPLALFCTMRNHFKEWEDLANEAKQHLASLSSNELHPAWAQVVVYSHNYTQEELEKALTIALQHNYAFEEAQALRLLGWLTRNIDLMEQGVAAFRTANLPYYLAQALDNTAFSYMLHNNLRQAEIYFLESLDIRTQIGDPVGQAYLLGNLATLCHFRGDVRGYTHYSERAYIIHHQMKDPQGTVLTGANFGLGLYLQGQLDQAHEVLDKLLQIANNTKYPQIKGRVLLYLSFMQDDTRRARELCEISIPLVANHPILRYTPDLSLAWIELREGNTQTAIHYLVKFYRPYQRINALHTAIASLLCFIAYLLIGDGCCKPAAELIGAALVQYPDHVGWFQVADIGRQAFASLQKGLSPTEYEQALAKGTRVDTLAEVERYITYFEAHAGERISVYKLVQAEFSSLIETLTSREQEILHLVAQGLKNQQIATALVVTEDTVKKHLSNIYGKLGVNTRTQMLVRAKELGLL